jgi:hypothetical protein
MEDFHRHPQKDKYYTESWTIILQADDGHIMYVNFMYTNIGVTSGRAAVEASISPPGQEVRYFGWESDTKDFKEEPGTGRIRIGPDSMNFDGRNLNIRIDHSDLRADLRLKGWMPGVRFHDGTIWLTEDRSEWVKAYFHIPRGDFEGEVVYGGKRFVMKGAGYFDHMVNNRLSGDYSTRWWTTRYFAPDHTVAFWAFEADKKHGGGIVARALVTDRTRVRTMTGSLAIKSENLVRDPQTKNHRYPTRFVVSLKRPGLGLAGTFTSRRVHDRNAVLERLPAVQRTIARMFAGNPVIYRMEGDADLSLVLDGGEPIPLDGKALMEAIVME